MKSPPPTHHRLKDQHTGWTVTGNPNNKVTWTSPAGRTYESYPHEYQDDDPVPIKPVKPDPEFPTPGNDLPPF